MSITLRFILNCFSGRTVQWLVLLFAKGDSAHKELHLLARATSMFTVLELALEAIGRFGMRFNER